MKTHAFIFDIDGVITKEHSIISKNIFSVCRLITPFLTFFLAELLTLNTKISNEAKKLIESKKDAEVIGVITDRSLLTTLLIFKANGIDLKIFDFIQTRTSFLNFFVPFFFRSPLPTEIWTVNKLKPHPDTLKKARSYCFRHGVLPKKIVLIEDLKEERLIARELGLTTKTDIKYLISI